MTFARNDNQYKGLSWPHQKQPSYSTCVDCRPKQTMSRNCSLYTYKAGQCNRRSSGIKDLVKIPLHLSPKASTEIICSVTNMLCHSPVITITRKSYLDLIERNLHILEVSISVCVLWRLDCLTKDPADENSFKESSSSLLKQLLLKSFPT